MDALELKDLIQKSESRIVQFKECIYDAYKIGTEMVADETLVNGITINDIDEDFFKKFIKVQTKNSIEELLVNALVPATARLYPRYRTILSCGLLKVAI